MEFRPATADDLPVLAELYATVVRKLGPSLYTPEQVQVWSASAEDSARFRDFILKAQTLVAMVSEHPTPVGFAGLEASGRIASLYVHADFGRRGIGSGLLSALLKMAETQGMTQLRCEASKFSRPVFERFGFQVDEVERGLHHGVPFMRYLMSQETAKSGEDVEND